MQTPRLTTRATVRAVAVAGLAVLQVACGLGSGRTHAYKLYPGPARAAGEVAIVKMDDAGVAEFDGRPVSHWDWTEVHLLPGEHRIRWQWPYGTAVDPGRFPTGGSGSSVTLAAGHVYSLRVDWTTSQGYPMFFWISDDTTGEVVVGKPDP